MLITKTYKCPNCGVFEYDHKNYDSLEHCLDCGEKVARVFEPTNYSWKCDGFCGPGFSNSITAKEVSK